MQGARVLLFLRRWPRQVVLRRRRVSKDFREVRERSGHWVCVRLDYTGQGRNYGHTNGWDLINS